MISFQHIKQVTSQRAESLVKTVSKTTWITEFLRTVDTWFRKKDYRYAYTYGDEKPFLLKPKGHFFMISWVLIFLITFLVLGLNLDISSYPAKAILLISYVGIIIISLRSGTRHLFWWQLGLLLVVSLAIWFYFAEGNIARDKELFRHVLYPAVWVILLGIVLARLLAKGLFQKYANLFAAYPGEVELFYSIKDHPMDVSYVAFLRNLVTAPLYHPLKLVFFPSLAMLVIADRYLMDNVALILLLLSIIYIAAASVHQRLAYLMELLDGLFFKGGHLVVSIIIVVLAVGRWAEQPHITTLIESSPGHVNLTIIQYLFAAYVLFWFYEYWANRYLLEYFVSIFVAKKSAEDVDQQQQQQTENGVIEKEPGKVTFNAKISKTNVKKKGRCLQAHGMGRLIVLGTNKETGRQNFHLYTRVGLIDTLFSKLDMKQEGVYEHFQKAQNIKQRMRFFFLVLNVYLISSIVIITAYYYTLPQKAAVTTSLTAKAKSADKPFDLHSKLFIESSNTDQPYLFVAASGGGTRAAIYGQSVLRGLQDQGLLDQVVLTSSVSGGSAAMAYFSAYRDELMRGNKDSWQAFSETMAEPFILDVLEGIIDWRIVAGEDVPLPGNNGSYQAGLRIGELLSESFSYRFGLNNQNNADRNFIGHQDQFGTIFNSTIVARFPRWNCEQVKANSQWAACLCSKDLTLAQKEVDAECSQLRTSLGQGGRLIFTNLSDTNGFPRNGQPVSDDEYFTYVTIQDPKVNLTRVAALSANFPPVFPNMAVDINQQRYWVTDGGASDNRGILSLLYTLRQAIVKEQARCEQEDCSRTKRPDLHIIVAEASATSLSFSRGSGISAVFGAPVKFASQLMVDLSRDIEKRYVSLHKDAKVNFHYLPMPMVLRSNGGLGTHWMLPSNVTFNQPLSVKRSLPKLDDTPIEFNGDQTRMLIDDLHLVEPNLKNVPELDRLWQWICKDEYSHHQQQWHKFLNQVKPGVEHAKRCP